MQAAILISAHKGFIVGIISLNLTIQENTNKSKRHLKMLLVLAKMFIFMHTSVIMGIISINLTFKLIQHSKSKH